MRRRAGRLRGDPADLAGVDLTYLALSADPSRSVSEALGTVRLRADPLSLLLPAAGVVVLAIGVVLAQAWWSGRRTGSAAGARRAEKERAP
ncbi:hypothetical protein NKH77_18725 [Streptomyces sp. M19]